MISDNLIEVIGNYLRENVYSGVEFFFVLSGLNSSRTIGCYEARKEVTHESRYIMK